jgi:hypothetical protein
MEASTKSDTQSHISMVERQNNIPRSCEEFLKTSELKRKELSNPSLLRKQRKKHNKIVENQNRIMKYREPQRTYK